MKETPPGSVTQHLRTTILIAKPLSLLGELDTSHMTKNSKAGKQVTNVAGVNDWSSYRCCAPQRVWGTSYSHIAGRQQQSRFTTSLFLVPYRIIRYPLSPLTQYPSHFERFNKEFQFRLLPGTYLLVQGDSSDRVASTSRSISLSRT